jgi:hypothetical protein
MGAGSGTGSDAGSISITRLGRPMSTAVLSRRTSPVPGVSPPGSSGAYPDLRSPREAHFGYL